MPKINQYKLKADTGLPENGEPEFLSIGILRKPHGINGEMRIEVWTDFPERLKKGVAIHIGENKQEYTIFSFKGEKNMYLIQLEGILDSVSCQPIVNKIVYVSSKNRPDLKDNQYYHHQIIGLNVYALDGAYLGKIKEIIRTGSNDVYVVEHMENDKKELLIPVIPAVIIKVDLDEHRIIIDPPQWV